MSAALDVRLLGPVTLWHGPDAVAINGQRRRTLVALLAANRGRTISVDAIADVLWEEALPAKARGTVQVLVYELRKVLEEAGLEAAALVQTSPPGYRLAIEPEQTDVGRFRRLRDAGHRHAAAGHPGEAAASYRAALAEWAGPACADLRGIRFADDLAAGLEEERLSALEATYWAELDLGRHRELAPELGSAAAQHPLRESIAAAYMTALYRCGRQADALQHYLRVRAVLADELGIDPGAQLQQVQSAILAQQPIPSFAAVHDGARAEAGTDPETKLEDTRPLGGELVLDDGRHIALDGRGTSIGRSGDNRLVLDDDRVSRHHAVVSASPTGYLLTDLHATNGCYVNDERVIGAVPLADGDELRFGHTVMHLRLPAARQE